MNGKTKRVIQIALVLAFVAAAVRLVVVLRERKDEGAMKVTTGRPAVDTGLSQDAYVVPKRLHAYDLQSARQLVGKPVWVREGYRFTAYPAAGGRVDFAQDAVTLLPIERIAGTDIRLVPSPGKPGQQQVMLFFAREAQELAVPIGTARGKDFSIYADEMFFIEDPHELYKHWPAEVWQAIERHEMKPGMSEMQASFALGMGTPAKTDDSSARVVVYPNGGRHVTVLYRGGKATRIDAAAERAATK